MRRITKSYLDELTYLVNGAAIEVHRETGPGLLESAYHECLIEELTLRKINFRTEMIVPFDYKGKQMTTQFRCDLYIENCLVIELKAQEKILPIHEAQILTYMKLLKAPKGVLYNFNVTNLFREGQKTYVNEYFRMLPE